MADQQQNDQRHRQSYSEHPVLDLKAFVGKLGDQDARIAYLLFALVREDYERSGDHIKELAKLFAPLRERYDREWAIVEQRDIVFTKAMSEVPEHEALAGDLDDAKAEDARATFRLVRRNYKSCQQFAELLGDIFSSLKKRNKDRRARILTVREIFERLKESTE